MYLQRPSGALAVRVTAEQLGRHRSTIHRELRRNGSRRPVSEELFPITAQELTGRRRIGKLHRDPSLARRYACQLSRPHCYGRTHEAVT